MGHIGGLLLDGYETPSGATGATRRTSSGREHVGLVSNSVPAGTAILGDFAQLRVYVGRTRTWPSMRPVTCSPGTCSSPVVRVGSGSACCSPSAFAICDLTGLMYQDGDLFDDGYMSVEECARRLNLTEERVIELAKRGVLRSQWDGVLGVQPAIVTGAVETR